jgi:hypothetical protein
VLAVYKYLLATVAVAALVVGAVALRDSAGEAHQQTKCDQSIAFSSGLAALRSGATDFAVVNKRTAKQVDLLYSEWCFKR